MNRRSIGDMTCELNIENGLQIYMIRLIIVNVRCILEVDILTHLYGVRNRLNAVIIII